MRIATVAAAATLLTAASTAQAGLIGKEFSVEYFLPTLGSVYALSSESPSNFVVGDGIETIINVEDAVLISVDFDDSFVSFHFDKIQQYSSQWNPADFNGLFFTLVGDGTLGISAFEVTPSPYMPDFDASRITVTANSIAFNWQGLRYDPLSTNNDGDGLAVAARAVPEPGMLALLGGGLLMLGLAARRRVLPG